MRDSRKYEVSSVKRHGKLGLDSACQHNSPSSFFIFSVANKIIERASRIFDVTYMTGHTKIRTTEMAGKIVNIVLYIDLKLLLSSF